MKSAWYGINRSPSNCLRRLSCQASPPTEEYHKIQRPFSLILLCQTKQNLFFFEDFDMVNYSIHARRQRYAAGVWDELTVSFLFQRRSGWYLLQGLLTFLTPIRFPLR
jgi:hypothetical protein